MKPNDEVVVTDVFRLRIQSAVAACLGALAVVLWGLIPPAIGNGVRSTHYSIPKPLFDVGDSVCANNGGRDDIIIHYEDDTFSFICKDGMSLRRPIVRVR